MGMIMRPSLLLAFVCAAVFSSAATEDTSEPVRPGAYGLKDGSDRLQVVEPFWNANAIMFLYAPAFDFRRIPEATRYRFAVTGASGYARAFIASDPWASLKEIWNEVPVGLTTVVCTGVGQDGKPCGEAGRRTFWRKAPFVSTPGHYPSARRGYAETAKLILSNQFATAEIQRMTKGEAPTWYRFPTKQLASIIFAACRRAKLCPETREASLAVARAAADYLLSLSPPAGSPLAHFTPTYKPDETHSDWAGTTMLIYPADGANAFLSAYEATGDRKYLEAARGACDTFIRLQGADGSWPLKVSLKDAKPLTANRCLTTRHIELFARMHRVTGDVRYREAGDKAFGFIERGPLRTWNWEGQFEDTPPTKPYMNLTKHDACSTAIYILQRYPGDAKRLAQARDLLRFAEDQFVNWEKPFADGKVLQPEKDKGYYNHYWDQDKWLMPSVFEQYGCYTPVDASAAKLIRTYLALYRAEGCPLDLAKARVLGDMITRMTDDDGLESTWWNTKELRQSIWYNCMFACEAALEELMCVAESPVDSAAKWIGDGTNAAPAFAKAFRLDGNVRSAVLAISGLGFYEACLNGRRIGDRELEPTPTDYTKRVYYTTYDVRALLAVTNELKVLLGNGWYNSARTGVWRFDRAPWRDTPRLVADLAITFTDGSIRHVVSDETWHVVPSPVLFNDLREGEIIRGGDIPVAPSGPRPATVVTAPKGRLVPSRHEPARVVERLPPVAVEALDGAWVLDFGKNLAGRVRMRIRGAKAGDVISFRHDERKPPAPRHIDSYIQALPSTNVWKLADAGYQMDRFIAAGVDGETYAPRFTYHGFRYVTVRGLRAKPQAADVAAELIRTDYAVSGSLVTSDATFNKLLDAAALAYDTNFTDGFPTDCPHREKNGWLGDAAATTTFALYRSGVENALKDWVRTIVDQQRPNGSVPCIVPDFGWEYDGRSCCNSGPAWGTALTTIPTRIYELRGDAAFLVEAYPAMKRYCDCVWADLKDGLCDSGLPDWCAAKLLEPGKVWLPRTPSKVSSTAYCYRSHVETAHAAELAGKSDEAKSLRERAEKIRQAFNRAFYRCNGVYHDGWAFGQALALNFGLVEPSEIPAVRRQLVKAVHAENDHIDFGFLGATVVFRELSKAGETALAYKMIMNDAPSFADWIRRGMTTLCETFPGELSQNHPMFGDFAAWAYEYLAGVQCTAPGFATFRFAPQPIDALHHVTAKVRTPHGDIDASWRRDRDRIVCELTVPNGCEASVCLPGRPACTKGPGRHVLALR